MGLLTTLRDIIASKLLDGKPLTAEEERAWAEHKASSTVFEPGSLDASVAPTQVVRKQQAGSYGWQMQQLMETEQRSDAAGARARNRLASMAARGVLRAGAFEHVKRDGTVETFDPTKHTVEAPVFEPEDPLYSRPSVKDHGGVKHVPERMTPEERARQIAAPDNLDADASEERPQNVSTILNAMECNSCRYFFMPPTMPSKIEYDCPCPQCWIGTLQPVHKDVFIP